eukprot:scaffold20632_cov63-Phaeocystis_antarctica.AAC.4
MFEHVLGSAATAKVWRTNLLRKAQGCRLYRTALQPLSHGVAASAAQGCSLCPGVAASAHGIAASAARGRVRASATQEIPPSLAVAAITARPRPVRYVCTFTLQLLPRQLLAFGARAAQDHRDRPRAQQRGRLGHRQLRRRRRRPLRRGRVHVHGARAQGAEGRDL